MSCTPPTMFNPNTDLEAIGVYNVFDQNYGASMSVCGMSTSGSASDNRKALQAAISTAIAQGGGTVLIPDGAYDIDGKITIGTTPIGDVALNIQGTSGNSTLSVTHSTDPVLFQVQTNLDNGSAVNFIDLRIVCKHHDAMTAIEVVQGQNIRLLRVTIADFPNSVVFNDAVQCSILECTFKSSKSAASGIINVTIGGSSSDIYIAASTFFSTVWGSPPGNGGVGISINNCERLRVTNVRLEGLNQGIAIAPGSGEFCTDLFFRNVSAFTSLMPTEGVYGGEGASLAIMPTGSGVVQRIECICCELCPTDLNMSQYDYGGIYVANDGGTATVDQIRLVSCYATRWPGPAVQIVGGSNIEIIGGCYSCNSTDTVSAPLPSCAILIDGTYGVSGVRLVGLASTNSVYDVHEGWLPATQEYAVVVQGSAAEIRVRDCNLTGNTTGAISVASGTTDVEVTECSGYNDKAVQFTPPINVAFANINLTPPYFGPITFYVWGGAGTAVKIDSHATGLAHGAFSLAPKQSAMIIAGIAPPSRLAIGQ
jgi:hypothetical protein